jgi:3-dehydroquinate dehydratase
MNVGAQSPSGAIVGVDQYLNVHQVNSDLKAENEKLKMQLEFLKSNHEKEIDSVRKEMESKIKEAQDSNQMFSQGLGLLMQRMGVGE